MAMKDRACSSMCRNCPSRSGCAEPLQGLDVRLEAVALGGQQFGGLGVADFVPVFTQFAGQVPGGVGAPAQKLLRVSTLTRRHQRVELVEDAGLGLGHRLAPATGPAHPPGGRRARLDLGKASADRRLGRPGPPADDPDSAFAQLTGLKAKPQPR
jgi:hypothetical protein